MAAVSVRLNPLGIALVVAGALCILLYFLGTSGSFSSEPKINMKELLSVGIDIAKKGGARVKAIRESNEMNEKVKGKTKEGASEMLTSGDLQSHRAMVYGLVKAYPELKVVSEEHETVPIDLNSYPDPVKNLNEIKNLPADEEIPIKDITVWIDPLDATQEYTENLKQFVTTMVCVAVKDKPTMGVIYFPFSDETVWGWVGHGSNLSPPQEQTKTENDPYKIIVSRSHAGTVEAVAKAALGEKTQVIPAGGAGYKTVQVIKGTADAYVHVTRIKKWDICAGNAIILSMKGRMTTIKGNSVNYADGNPVNDDGLLATLFEHDKLLKDLRPAADTDKQKGHKRLLRSVQETQKRKLDFKKSDVRKL